MRPTQIVIFAGAPVRSTVKTRLIPAVGGSGAARLALRMLLATIAQAVAARMSDPELCASLVPTNPSGGRSCPTARASLPARATRTSSSALAERPRG